MSVASFCKRANRSRASPCKRCQIPPQLSDGLLPLAELRKSRTCLQSCANCSTNALASAYQLGAEALGESSGAGDLCEQLSTVSDEGAAGPLFLDSSGESSGAPTAPSGSCGSKDASGVPSGNCVAWIAAELIGQDSGNSEAMHSLANNDPSSATSLSLADGMFGGGPVDCPSDAMSAIAGKVWGTGEAEGIVLSGAASKNAGACVGSHCIATIAVVSTCFDINGETLASHLVDSLNGPLEGFTEVATAAVLRVSSHSRSHSEASEDSSTQVDPLKASSVLCGAVTIATGV